MISRHAIMAFAALGCATTLTLVACNGLVGLREPTEIDDSDSGDSGKTTVIEDAGTDSMVVTPGPPPTFPTLV